MSEEEEFQKALLFYKSSDFPKFNSDDYIEIKQIGKGTSGDVSICRDIKTKEEVIIKKIYSGELNLKLLREIDVMNKLQHPCLCNLIASNILEDKSEVEISLLLPYIRNGDLKDTIKLAANNKLPSWDTTAKMKAIYGIAAGMAYMHSKKAVHRDLKDENILMDDNYEIRISDFGSSRFTDEVSNGLSSCIGTPYYMAPEIINGEEYTDKVDVYSYSIILYAILYTNKFPPTSMNKWIMGVLKGERLPIDESKFLYGDGLLQLIKDCWSHAPIYRPSFEQILDILPKILPKDTDIQSFNEYAKRVNPNFGKMKNKRRTQTLTPTKKKTLLFIEKAKKEDNPAKNKSDKITQNDAEEGDKNLQSPSIEIPNNDIDANNEENEILLLDENIQLNTDEKEEGDEEEEIQIDLQNQLMSLSTSELPKLSQSYNPSKETKPSVYKIALQNAQNGEPRDLFDYGLSLYTGQIGNSNLQTKNVSRGIEIIKEAAQYGSVDANYFIGMNHLNGTDGFEIDLKEARRCISIAADQGRPLALFYMGFYDQRGLEMYPPGIDPKSATNNEKYVWPVNKKEGFKYAKKAAKKGHAMSAIMVARSYENGVPSTPDSDFSLRKDPVMATKYFKMAADNGDVSSMVKFSKRAEEGIGMKKDPQLTVRYLKIASRREDMHAMFNLGNIYFKGLYGVQKNQKKGADLIKHAADKGLPDAQLKYSKILKKGADGVPKNKEESLRYEKMSKK